MSQPFDPYHNWLGIPPKDQPPDHYRLLGVQALETDVGVIANAADRQMGHVRTFQAGDHAALSQQLLNEIATARVCLLNPQKKAGYDEQLRGKQQERRRAEPQLAQAIPLAAAKVGTASRAPAIVAHASSAPTVATGPGNTAGSSARPSRGRSAKPGRKSPLLIAAACGLVPLLIIAVVVVGVRMRPDAQQEVAQREVEEPASNGTTPQGIDPNDGVQGNVTLNENPLNGNPQNTIDPTPLLPNSPVIDVSPLSIDPPSVDPTSPSVPESDTPPKDTEPPNPTDPNPRDDEPAPPQPKASPPDAAAVRAAKLEISELFDLDKLKTTLAKHAAAQDVLKAAAEEKPYTPAHFAALCIGRDLAASVANIDTAFGAIDQLDAVYVVDVWAMKLKVGEAASRNVPTNTRVSLVQTLTQMTRQAMADDRYEIAGGIARVARDSARRTQDQDLIRQTAALASKAARVQQEFQATIAPALATLESSPEDAEANLIAGKHYCLNRADWQVGLKMLAQSAHAQIKAAALLDLKRPTDPGKQVEVGDAWYTLAKSDRTIEGFHARAHYWYAMTRGKIGGLSKLKVERRMEETAKFALRAPQPAERRVGLDKPASNASLQNIKVVLRSTITEKIKSAAGVRNHVAFAPDGRTVAVGYPHEIKIFDAFTSAMKRKVTDHSSAVITSFAYAPDGRTIAFGKSDGKLKFWDLVTNTATRWRSIGTGPLNSMVFSPDGKTLACSVNRQQIHNIDTATWQPRQRLNGGQFDMGPLAFSTKNNAVAIGHDNGSMSVLDFETGKMENFVKKRHTASVLAVALSLDGTMLATGSADHSISLSNPDDGKIIAKFTGHQGAVLGVAFSPDSKVLASVSADNTVKLWDVVGEKLWQTLEGHPSQASGENTGSIAFSPDGRLLVSCGNYTIKFWMASRR